jgi:inner membrane protein
MDSLTQIVLGASVGELVCGKKIGNKAIVWGAIAGTIPDLDILASPMQDLVQQLSFHRSITHSILFCIVMSPIFGWLLHKIYRREKATFSDWSWLFFWGFSTHALLDSFTTWGTQIFWPFSTYPVAFHNIFVIDPLYTLPFLLCTVAVMFYKRTNPSRAKWNRAGLIISTTYMLITISNKLYANAVFEETLQNKNIKYSRITTRPTPGNAILWCATAETKNGYLIGYYSLLDKNRDISFRFYEKNHELISPLLPDVKLEKLLDVTTGFYTVSKHDSVFTINDLRFGQLDGWEDGKEGFVFAYNVEKKEGQLSFSQKQNDLKKARELLPQLWKRILGSK